MKVRHVGMLAGLLAVGTLAAPLTSFAETTTVKIVDSTGGAKVYVQTAPPAAKVVAPPTETKVGYVWSSGYWNWNGTAYVWTEGSWVQVVETKKWIEPTWTQEGAKWYFTPGHWG